MGKCAGGNALKTRPAAALCLLAALSVASARAADRHATLTNGTLYVPSAFQPVAGKAALTVHLHGAASATEPQFLKAGLPGVLVSITLNGLSSVYTAKFSDPTVFDRVQTEAASALKSMGFGTVQWDRVTVSSFSAGYGGVRELLKTPRHYARMDGLVLADSLYGSFTGDQSQRKLDTAQLADFARYAKDAAAGRKRLVMSSSHITPPYAATYETMGYLAAQAGAPVVATSHPAWTTGMTLKTSARKGRFTWLDFAGETGDDHLAHLRNIATFWTLLTDRPKHQALRVSGGLLAANNDPPFALLDAVDSGASRGRLDIADAVTLSR
jgi:hypothetical protein